MPRLQRRAVVVSSLLLLAVLVTGCLPEASDEAPLTFASYGADDDKLARLEVNLATTWRAGGGKQELIACLPSHLEIVGAAACRRVVHGFQAELTLVVIQALDEASGTVCVWGFYDWSGNNRPRAYTHYLYIAFDRSPNPPSGGPFPYREAELNLDDSGRLRNDLIWVSGYWVSGVAWQLVDPRNGSGQAIDRGVVAYYVRAPRPIRNSRLGMVTFWGDVGANGFSLAEDGSVCIDVDFPEKMSHIWVSAGNH